MNRNPENKTLGQCLKVESKKNYIKIQNLMVDKKNKSRRVEFIDVKKL